MIDFDQFKEYIVIPSLCSLNPVIDYSEEATDLLMMTCAHESLGGRYIRQKGVGVGIGAYGVYQMEIATHEDIWDNFLAYREDIANTVGRKFYSEIIGNLYYATAMARVHYFRVPEALPSKEDRSEDEYLTLLGEYAKKYYNTHLGKATAEDYVDDYKGWRDR